MLVSVIVPVYNVEQYLRECIDSILASDYKSIQVICVDDGSTDSSGAILDEYAMKDDRIQVFHKQNGGLSSARNFGLKYATGDLISFIDSDDTVSDDVFGRAVDAFILHKALSMYVYDIEAFDDNCTCQSAAEINKWLDMPFEHFQLMDFDSAYRANIHVCNKIFKHSFIEDIQFPDGLLYEDIYFMWNVFLKQPLAYFDQYAKYNYRIRSNSIMSDTVKTKEYSRVIHHLKNIEKLINDKKQSTTLTWSDRLNLNSLIDIYERRTKRAGLEQDYKKIEDYANKLRQNLKEK